MKELDILRELPETEREREHHTIAEMVPISLHDRNLPQSLKL